MSYAIFRTQKIKKTVIDKCQRHNQRENENYSNSEIDKDKKHLNYELHNENNIVYQKEIDLKIKDRYKGKKSIRKDAVLNIECLITSDKEFFDRIGAEETKRYFEEAYNFIKNKFGEENLIYATVHMDETTPHMHAGFVPITKDGRLSAKDYLDGKERLRNLQDDFHKYISSKGFELERGISSDETHAKNIKIKDLKKKALKELEDIKKDIEILDIERNKRIEEANKINDVVSKNNMSIWEINQIKYEEIEDGIFKRKKTSKIEIDIEDFNKLKDAAIKAYTQHNLYSNYESDINDLKKLNDRFLKENKEYRLKLDAERREHSYEIHKINLRNNHNLNLLNNLSDFIKSNNLFSDYIDFIENKKNNQKQLDISQELER